MLSRMRRYIICVAICWVASTLCFRLLSLGLVFTRVLSPATSEHDEVSAPTAEHLVFIGDSLTRYQFLALLYKLSHPGEQVPDYVVCEKVFGSWQAFYENSSGLFGHSCSCDCFRPDYVIEQNLVSPFTPMRENRFCTLDVGGIGSISLTYLQLFGETESMHGTVLPNETHLATIDTVQRPDKWSYLTVSQCINDFVSRLSPRPTQIFIGTGAWPHARIMSELKDTLIAASRLTRHVYWKETPPFQNSLTGGKGLSRPQDIDERALEHCASGLCKYIPFPDVLPRSLVNEDGKPDYWDNFHFSSGQLYSLWNAHVIAHAEGSTAMNRLSRQFTTGDDGQAA